MLKYLLIPVTMIIWYLIPFYSIYLGMIAFSYLFSLNSFLLLFFFTLFLILIGWTTHIAPTLLQNLILKLYGYNWFSVIIHSLVGLLGIASVFIDLYNNPMEVLYAGEYVSVIEVMWDSSKFKTISLALPYVGLVISIIWATVVSPITMKVSQFDVDY